MADLTSRIAVIISASSAGAVKELNDLQRQADKAGDSFDTIGKRAGLAGSTIKAGLVAGATALVGTQLVTFLDDAVNAYGDAAKAAGELAATTGSSVESVSRMTAALEDNGIASEESAKLLGKFTSGFGKNEAAIRDLGVVLKRGEDGAIDYAAAMVDTIDAINRIPDAAKRAEVIKDIFGKQAVTALNELAASGVDLADAMEAVSKYRVFDTDDVRRAVAYDDAMDALGGSVQGLQFALGQALIPALSGAVEGFAGLVESSTPVIEFFAGIPAEVYLVVGAVAALNVALKSQLVAGAFSAVLTGGAQLITGMAILRTEMGLTAAAATAASNTMKAAFLSNPVGWALIALATAFTGITLATKRSDEQVIRYIDRLHELEDAGHSTADALGMTAEEFENSAGWMDRFLQGMNTGNWWDWLAPNRWVSAVTGAFTEGGADVWNFRDRLEDAREELGEYEYKAGLVQVTQAELNELIASGVTSGAEFDAALRDAAEAAQDTAREQEILNAALAAYNGITSEAIELTDDFYGALLSTERANQRVTDAIKAYNEEGGQTRENLLDIVDAARSAADAQVQQWEIAQQRLGIYVSESERAAQRVSALRVQLQQPNLPPDAAARLQQEVASIIAAATRENGGKIPVGFTVEDIDASIATIQAALNDPNLDPNIRTALELDLASLETVKTNIAALGTEGATEVKVEVTAETAEAQGKVDGLKTQLDGVEGDRTASVTVTTSFEPGGYEAVKARSDFLAQTRQGLVTIDTSFEPGGYNAIKARSDFLAQTRRGLVNIDVAFQPGGYNAAKARVDYLAQNRTATITVNQVTRRSTVDVGGGGEGFSLQRQQRIPNLYANVQPNNVFKVNIDGQPLRAWIRTEVAAAQPVRAGVA